MMYSILVVAHVIVAVLGVGTLGAIVVVSSLGPSMAPALPSLLRTSLVAMVLMLTTGIAIEAAGGAVFHETWWFRISVLLLVVTGAVHASTRRLLREPIDRVDDVVTRRVRNRALLMSALVAAIVALMEAKPW